MNTGFTVWFTGMSGTGKTALANYLAPRLRQVGTNTEILDEAPLGAELWGALVAAVSPYKSNREENRRAINRYVEVYVDCPTDKLIERDSTGRYKKALGGEIPNFIGITEPYEPPSTPEVTIHSDVESVEEGGRKVLQALLDLGYIAADQMRTITGERARSTHAKKARAGKTSRPGAAKGARKARPVARAARVAKAAKKKKGAAKQKSR